MLFQEISTERRRSMFKPIGEVLQSLSPLNNPSHPADTHTLTRYKSSVNVRKGDEGVREPERKGEKGKVEVLYLVARCFECGGPNWFALDRNKVRTFSKCQCCGSVCPTESFIMVSSDYDQHGTPLYEKRMRMLGV